MVCAGAWIITGGTHTGVMKHVGQAVRDHALSSSSMRGQIVAIGVATWGTLHNRHALVQPEVRTEDCLHTSRNFLLHCLPKVTAFRYVAAVATPNQ